MQISLNAAVLARASSLAILAAFPAHAWAEQPGGPNQVSADEFGTNDIVVTARRREERLQDVPVAVTALNDAALAERGINSAADLASATPSLQMQPGLEGRQAARFYIRGQGVGFGGAPPSVVTYFNEVPLDPNGGATFALNDMQVAQVLRGPQGTLFGRNANGGAVVLVPKAPGRDIDAYVDASYGNYDFVQVKAAATIPISDTLGVRVSGEYGRRDGYTKNISGKDYDNFDAGSWRVFLRWTPSDSLTNDLIYAGSKGSSNGIGTILAAVRGNAALPGIVYPRPDLPLVTGTGLPDDLAFQNSVGPRVIDSPADHYGEKRELHLVTNTTTLELGGITLKNIFGFEYVDACPSLPVTSTATNFFVSTCFAGNYLADNAGVRQYPTTEQTQITEEFNISGKTGGLDWIVGAFALWSDPKGTFGEFRATRAAKSLFVANVSSALPQDRSQAIYGQATYALTDRLKATAGLRYTWDQRKLQFGQLVSMANGAPGTFICGSPGLDPSTPVADCVNVYKDSFSDYGYTFGLDYKVTDDILLYAQTRRGYKSGGFNSTSTSASPLYKPEILEDIELGAKAGFHTGAVRGTVNLAYFHGWYTGIQQQLSVVNGGQATVITTNAGKANLDGVELEANITLFDRLTLTAAWSHIDASYNSCPSGVPVADLTPSDCFIDSGLDVTASKFVSTPKDTLNLTVRYDLPLGDAGDLSAFLSYYTRSKVAFAADNVLNYEGIAPGYEVFNGRIDWKNIFGSSVSAGFFMNNIFDKDYVATGIGLGGLIGTTSYIYGEPRTYGVNLRWSY